MDLDKLFTITQYQSTRITIPIYRHSAPCSSSSHNHHHSAVSSSSSSLLHSTNNTTNDDTTSNNNENQLSFELYTSPAACTDYDLTGQILWPVSKLLAYYIASQVGQDALFSSSSGTNIVELGSGCGFASIVAAFVSPPNTEIIVTDGNELVLDLVQKNLTLNFPQENNNINKVSARQLIWGNYSQCHELLNSFRNNAGKVDHVITADVVQWPAVIEPLLHTVKFFLWYSCSKQACFILGIVNRANDTYRMFFDIATTLGFTFTKIHPKFFLKNGIIPTCCQETGHETEIYKLVLTNRKDEPILMNQNKKEDVMVGTNYENTLSLPC